MNSTNPQKILHRKKGITSKIVFIIKRELTNHTTPIKAALSLALGIALAITPFHGLQIIIILLLAFMFKLNRPLAILGVSISPAPLLPFWFAVSIAIGQIVLNDVQTRSLSKILQNTLPKNSTQWLQNQISIEVLPALAHYICGSMVLAVLCGCTSFIISLYFFSRFNKAHHNK